MGKGIEGAGSMQGVERYNQVSTRCFSRRRRIRGSIDILRVAKWCLRPGVSAAKGRG